MSYFERPEVEKECAFLVQILEIVRRQKGIKNLEWSNDVKINNGIIERLLEQDHPKLFGITQEVLTFVTGERFHYIADVESKSTLSNMDEYELAWNYTKVFSNNRSGLLFMPRVVAESISEKLFEELPNKNFDKIFCCSESALSVLLALSKYEIKIDFALPVAHNVITDLFVELIKLIGKAEIRILNLETDYKGGITLPDEGYQVGFYLMPMGQQEHWLLKRANFKRLANDSIILLEPGVMWSSRREFIDLRKELVETGFLKEVIQLPQGVISAVSLSPSLLLLNKNERLKTDGLLFADLSSEKLVKNKDTWSVPFKNLRETRKVTSIYEIRRDDHYVLDPKRYEFGKGSLLALLDQRNSEMLGSIAEVVRAQSIPVSNKATSLLDLEKFHEVSTSDIDDIGFVSQPKKVIEVAEEGKRRASQAELRENDIVLAIKGSIGKVGLITKNTFLDKEGNFCRCVAGQSFVIIRLEPYKCRDYSPEYLFRYLKTKIVQEYFESFSLGTAIRMLKISDVKVLPVKTPLPSELQREKELHEDQIRIKWEILELRDKLYQSEMAWPK